ncbi:hypothetical protein CBR_g58829 [Chara braunii]|uniref:C2 domain-containing protein n=1 Tax=Chara braunii TaxID=69332 RepID=A0A388K8J4_CHABU|nr:hypothetical protein CBR_g58829 [Chara braunii]|eukprot:GBG66339.1 hypothetical protein CBR_g58829 [Chara braunii]
MRHKMSRAGNELMANVETLWCKGESAVESILQWPLFVHLVFVMALIWIAGKFQLNFLFVFTWGVFYLWKVECKQRRRLADQIRRKLQQEMEKRTPTTDSETLDWLNALMEKMWPAFLEQYLSRSVADCLHINLNIYKPKALRKIVIDCLRLGTSPPLIKTAKVYRDPRNGDHAILEIEMSYVAADDMRVELIARLKKAGLGLSGKLYGNNLRIEGKMRLGFRFVQYFPYVGRLSVSFVDPPAIGLSVKPLSSNAIDLADLPGIATWLMKALCNVVETTMVEPKPMILDLIKILGTDYGLGYYPVCYGLYPGEAFAVIEVLDGKELEGKDRTGFSDPYVKLQIGRVKMRTSFKKQTISPYWNEIFRLRIAGWHFPVKLHLRVRDHDSFGKDDELGYTEVDLADYRNGERHEIWKKLDGAKSGIIHMAITIVEQQTPGEGGVPNDVLPVRSASMPIRPPQPADDKAGQPRPTILPSKSMSNLDRSYSGNLLPGKGGRGRGGSEDGSVPPSGHSSAGYHGRAIDREGSAATHRSHRQTPGVEGMPSMVGSSNAAGEIDRFGSAGGGFLDSQGMSDNEGSGRHGSSHSRADGTMHRSASSVELQQEADGRGSVARGAGGGEGGGGGRGGRRPSNGSMYAGSEGGDEGFSGMAGTGIVPDMLSPQSTSGRPSFNRAGMSYMQSSSSLNHHGLGGDEGTPGIQAGRAQRSLQERQNGGLTHSGDLAPSPKGGKLSMHGGVDRGFPFNGLSFLKKRRSSKISMRDPTPSDVVGGCVGFMQRAACPLSHRTMSQMGNWGSGGGDQVKEKSSLFRLSSWKPSRGDKHAWSDRGDNTDEETCSTGDEQTTQQQYSHRSRGRPHTSF